MCSGGGPHLLQQLQGDSAPWLSFYALPPETELGIDGAMEQEVVLEALRVEGADRWVVADLLRDEPETQVLPAGSRTGKMR